MTAVQEKSGRTLSAPAFSTDKELFATRYKQGGRTVYGVALTPAQITSVVKRPDPLATNPGNRRIRLDHAQAFARYFIEHEEWVVPGIILRAPNIFSFEQEADGANLQIGTVRYPERNQGDIQILDGQHRILGFHLALEIVDAQMEKARNAKATARRVQDANAVKAADQEITRLDRVRDRLASERIAVEIQVTDDLSAYRQMFFDIAENALGITASVKARFDSRKVVNRALPEVLVHPLLATRVDLEADRIPASSPNLLTARHIMETLRVLTVGYDGRVSKRLDKELDEKVIARSGIDFFDALLEAFPVMQTLNNGQITPEMIRKTSMLGSAAFIRVLAGAYYELIQNHAWSRSAVIEYFSRLAKHTNAPAHLNSIWKLHAAPEAFHADAFGPNQRRQDAKGLVLSIVDWGVMKEAFVDAEPQPAPVMEVDEDDALDFAPSHNTKKLEAELRAEDAELAEAGKARARSVKKG